MRGNKAAAILVSSPGARQRRDVMDIETEFTVLETEDLRYPVDRFDRVSVALHWLTVLLVAFQLATAFLPHEGRGAILLTLHRSGGVLTLAVVLFRLAWRARFAYLPPFPVSMPKPQQWAAKANEFGLYAVLVLQPLTGLADGVFHGRPFVLFGVQVPALMAFDKPLFHLSGELHELGAKVLIALIGLHIGAALLHALVLRDGIVRRMLPRRSAR
jgi:cytochrome b561